MKALVCVTPGKLEYADIPEPQSEKGRVILKIQRIGVCGTDLHAFEGAQPFFSYPRILGHELSGIVADTGGDTSWSLGEHVTFIPYFHCGHCIACRRGKPNCCVNMNVCGVHSDGGMVEYLSVPGSCLVRGYGLSDEALALVEPLSIGAHGITRAEVREGEFVLVVGAGPIGLGTMAFAGLAGAQVIAMDVNNSRLDFCQNMLRIPYRVNSMEKDSAQQIRDITGGDMPTLVIDATGNLKAINHSFQFLAHGARYVLIGLQREEISFSHPEFHKREAMLMSSRNATREDFDHVVMAIVKGLVNPGHLITHSVPFGAAGREFGGWLDPGAGVIKAMIHL